jgi:PTH1 family peptidyl-tRNA hydrolase
VATDRVADTPVAADPVTAETGPWLVVGLGNPGPQYVGTRHNTGALVADILADRVRGSFKSHKARADVVEARIGADRVVLAKPRSYMNESGGPVAGLRDFFKVSPARLVVVHDELDLPFGTLRVKLGGGDNGHNGLKSLRKSLGTGDYLRVRIGIGRPPGRQDPADWVLRDFSGAEKKELGLQLERAADAVESLIADGLAAAQNHYND